MICPSDGVLCVCDRPDGLCPFEFEKPISPPPPTLAEIERLAGDVSLALSALMAAIRLYGRE